MAVLPGIGGLIGGSKSETQVPFAEGSMFGAYTNGYGGQGAITDGITAQAYTACGRTTFLARGHFGKTWAAPKAMSKVVAYGPTDNSLNQAGVHTTVELYGKNGAAPSSPTDGTLLGTSVAVPAGQNAVATLDVTDKEALWDHVFVSMFKTGGGTTTYWYLAEVVFFSME